MGKLRLVLALAYLGIMLAYVPYMVACVTNYGATLSDLVTFDSATGR